MSITEQRPAMSDPQPAAPRSKWVFVVGGGLLLLLAVLAAQLWTDEPGPQGGIRKQNQTLKELLGPKH